MPRLTSLHLHLAHLCDITVLDDTEAASLVEPMREYLSANDLDITGTFGKALLEFIGEPYSHGYHTRLQVLTECAKTELSETGFAATVSFCVLQHSCLFDLCSLLGVKVLPVAQYTETLTALNEAMEAYPVSALKASILDLLESLKNLDGDGVERNFASVIVQVSEVKVDDSAAADTKALAGKLYDQQLAEMPDETAVVFGEPSDDKTPLREGTCTVC